MASQITSVSIVFSPVCPGADQRKHKCPVSSAFVRGIHRWPMDSPHKGPLTRKISPFHDVIMNTVFSRGTTSDRNPPVGKGYRWPVTRRQNSPENISISWSLLVWSYSTAPGNGSKLSRIQNHFLYNFAPTRQSQGPRVNDHGIQAQFYVYIHMYSYTDRLNMIT